MTGLPQRGTTHSEGVLAVAPGCSTPPDGPAMGVGTRWYLREFLGSPGPMLTCSTLLLGFSTAWSPMPCWNCTCREPPALQGPQVSFFSFNSNLQEVHGTNQQIGLSQGRRPGRLSQALQLGPVGGDRTAGHSANQRGATGSPWGHQKHKHLGPNSSRALRVRGTCLAVLPPGAPGYLRELSMSEGD